MLGFGQANWLEGKKKRTDLEGKSHKRGKISVKIKMVSIMEQTITVRD